MAICRDINHIFFLLSPKSPKTANELPRLQIQLFERLSLMSNVATRAKGNRLIKVLEEPRLLDGRQYHASEAIRNV